MSTERAEAAVERAIAAHVAVSFRRRRRSGKPEAIASHIRSRITDSFRPIDVHIEQDNQPPALVAFCHRITAAFAPIEQKQEAPERSPRLAELQGSLENLRSTLPAVSQLSRLNHARTCLLIERQQLLMQNEFTEGFGRIECWILSISFLLLVLLGAVSILWALPLLGLSIGRSWYLDRRCKHRLKKVAEIDVLVARIEHVS